MKRSKLLSSAVSFLMFLSLFPINKASFLFFGEIPCPKCLQK